MHKPFSPEFKCGNEASISEATNQYHADKNQGPSGTTEKQYMEILYEKVHQKSGTPYTPRTYSAMYIFLNESEVSYILSESM